MYKIRLFRKNFKIQLGAILALLLSVSACSTSVQISSNPSGANVWVKPLGSGTRKSIGQTPLTFDPSDLDGVPNSSGPLSVQMEKDGYQPADIIVTDIGSGKVEVHKDLVAGPGFDNPSKLNSHLERVFTAQQLIQVKRFDDAEKILTTVKNAVPTLAVVHELLGGVYFLKGEKVKALDAFQRALALNPTSIDAINMTRELADQAGTSAPVTEETTNETN